jgi:hypothetical protein
MDDIDLTGSTCVAHAMVIESSHLKFQGVLQWAQTRGDVALLGTASAPSSRYPAEQRTIGG